MSAESAKPKTPAEVLREPFPAAAVGKLPRVTCKPCREAQGKVCSEHKKTKCDTCGNFITSAHIHLDYVGHAAVTDRLLQADPAWTYRLLAANPDGSPVSFTTNLSDPLAKVGLWIELTVAEVATPGFGEGKNFKEAISDAIRNAAMRRGVALDLWSKEGLHDDSEPKDAPSPGSLPAPHPTGDGATNGEAKALAERLLAVCDELGVDAATREAVEEHWNDERWLRDSLATAEANLAKFKADAESPFVAPEPKK